MRVGWGIRWSNAMVDETEVQRILSEIAKLVLRPP